MAEVQGPNHLPGPHPAYYNAVMRGVMKPFLAMYGGVEFRGAEVLHEIEGPAIVAPRHQSMIDVPAVAQAAFEGAGEHIHWMAKKELWKVPGLGSLIEWGGGFQIDRDADNMPPETEEHLKGIIPGNPLIGIFPEGTRRSGDTIEKKDIRAGAPLVATMFGLPVIPVGVAGTEKGDRGPIKVVFGEPITHEEAHIRRPNKLRRAMVAGMQEAQDEAVGWRAHAMSGRQRSR